MNDEYLSDYGANHPVATKLVKRILKTGEALCFDRGRRLVIMEVCGTHTVAFARAGITRLVEDIIDLQSGPGCPVCVTHQADLDCMVALAGRKDFSVVTFGDLLRVPASDTSLEREVAGGADVHICYSPADSLDLARQLAPREVVMLAVGFETTAPAIAATVLQAGTKGLKNWSIYCALKKVPPALRALLGPDGHNLDGMILPGHVAAVTGRREFDFIAWEYGIPAVVTGFEPVDLCFGLYRLLCDIKAGEKKVVNSYSHVVKEEGNREAQAQVSQCFEITDARWRGFGLIPDSGLKLNKLFARFDAQLRFGLDPVPACEESGCLCGRILTGKAKPPQCPHFGSTCTPLAPIGPCMVATEGACGAYYRFMAG